MSGSRLGHGMYIGRGLDATALDAGGGAAFADAVDAFARATRALERADISDPLLDVGIERVDAARAALLAAHAAVVARAEATEQSLRTIALQVADYSDDLDDFYDRVSAVVAHLWPLPEDAPTPPAPRLNDTTTTGTAADVVVVNGLVHGGPPRDSLDDGR